MFENLFKNKKEYKQLGKTLVVIEVKGGKVPEHCDGITLHVDGSFDRHPSGDELKSDLDKRLLFIHKGPYTLQFSPNDQAPEAGLEIELQAEFENELGLFLSSWDKTRLTTDDLMQKAKQIGGHYILQPGMTQREINHPGGVLANYSNAMQAYGFRCRGMQRKDLHSQMNTAELLWKNLSTEQIVEKVEERQQQALEIELAGIPITKKVSTPFFRISQFDQKLTRNLQRELSYISKQMQRFVSEDAQQVETVYKLQQQLQRCQSHSQMLPPLNSSISELKLTKSQQRQKLTQLQYAAQNLKGLKISLSKIHHGTVSDKELSQLAEMSYRLEIALTQRAGKES